MSKLTNNQLRNVDRMTKELYSTYADLGSHIHLLDCAITTEGVENARQKLLETMAELDLMQQMLRKMV